MTRPHLSDAQRRTRLGRRHALAPAHRVDGPVAAARSVVALHATEPASVHLAVVARTHGVTVADIDRALYEERTLVKQLAMRRTLFAFPRELVPMALSSASDRVATTLESRITRAVLANGISTDPEAWLEEACCSVEASVVRAGALTNTEIRELVPMVRGQVAVGSGKWGQDVQISPWVCTLLSLRGRLVRGAPTGAWTAPRPRWHPTGSWLGEPVQRIEPREAFAELVRRWLERFGPGTLDDIVWWLGATKGIVRKALEDVAAVEVGLDDGSAGYVLPDDVEDDAEVEPWAALLPVLDATTMGWKGRRFYLDADDVPYLFDTNGNAGTTAWWDGRIVGCWVQDDEGTVQVLTRHALPREAAAALDVEASRLTAWLGGTRVRTVYSSRQMKGEPLD
ncbi:MAG TPA: winged helix DNA-binding domain-containing protein [Propionibacteriaceae bacterium]|nr:winged helix DNA-binding domain-containing protein [Propionibacteriaceae bacterium]